MDQGKYQFRNLLEGRAGLIIINDDLRSVVNVVCLNEMPFKPAPNRLQLYGQIGDRLFAFDTDSNPRNVEEMGVAIHWFATSYLNQPDMVLSLVDPRPLVN